MAYALLEMFGKTAVPAIRHVTVAFPEPTELAAVKFIAKVPALVGVPEINPVEVFKDRPLGKPEAAKLVGLLVAEIL